MLKTAWIDPKLYQKWYDLGYSDQAIAEKINVTVGAVFKWRKRNNIPANFDQKLTRLPIQFATLKANGSYDILYIHANIRSSLGWKPEDRLQVEIIDGELRITGTVQRTPQDRKVIDTLEAEKLYYEGKTDLQISEALGVSVRSAQMWRYRRRLPPNRVKKIMDKQRAEIMYNQGKDDKQVADALEVSKKAVSGWRARTGRDRNELGTARVK